MRRRTFFLGLTGLAGCTRDTRPRLNVFNWSNYVAENTIPNFEAEFGVRVRYAVYESNEEMFARVMSGNSGWDVVFPASYFLPPMLENNLVARLRHEWLPNVDRLEAVFRAPRWDPGLEWSVPYMWGSSGILHHERVSPAPASWADLWSARLGGRMTMLDDPVEVFGACLKKLGYSINSDDPEELRLAQKEALAQKPLLRAYLNAEVRDQVVAGDVLAAQAWATTAQQAIGASGALRYVYPAEGFALYCDTAVILRESERQELAHRFLDYLLRPEVAAAVAAETYTATANGAARALLPAEMREDPTLYPPAEVLARGEWIEPVPAGVQRLRDRLWTEVKSA